jgi:transcriptional regulator with XRE-family HTH domain
LALAWGAAHHEMAACWREHRLPDNLLDAVRLMAAVKEEAAFAKRVGKMLAIMKISPAELARKLGMDSSNVHKYLTGRANPSHEFIKNMIEFIEREYDIDIKPGLLLYGKRLFDLLKETADFKDRLLWASGLKKKW